MKILLTGGNGMVGKNIRNHSSAANHQILAPSKNELDLRDMSAVETYLHRERPDLVIHSAGKVGGIQANIADPVGFLVENLDIGRNVILASHKAGINNVINLGSSCMYPKDVAGSLSEDQVLTGQLEPTNEGYALAKIVTARLCEYINKSSGTTRYRTLIPCNLYGPHDKFDPQRSHLIPAVIHKVHQAKKHGAPSVEVWGDGTARREFMYAPDLAAFIFQYCERLTDLPEMLNVGLGFDYSINEYYQAAFDVIGYGGELVHDLTKPVGMKRKLVSTARLKNVGWKAATDLKSGIALTYDHYLKLGN